MSDPQRPPGRRSRAWHARVPEADLAQVRQWAGARIPVEMADQARLDVEVHGPTITIVERRPPSQPQLGPEWSRQRIAQLRYDPDSSRWTLCHSDPQQRWHLCDLAPEPDVGVLIDEMERDPDGLFWR